MNKQIAILGTLVTLLGATSGTLGVVNHMKQEQIKNLQSNVSDLNIDLSKKDSEIKELQHTSDQKDIKIKNLRSYVSGLNVGLSKKDSKIKELQHTSDQKDIRIRNLRYNVSDLKDDLSKKDSKIKELQHDLIASENKCLIYDESIKDIMLYEN